MDRLTSMAVFVKAVETGSFAAAAAALGISAPMVGKHVQFLEARLGARLLNRTTRRQALTDLGQDYYDRCRAVLAEAEAADALAEDSGGAIRGRLRVSAPAHFGRHCVAPVLLGLAHAHPGLRLDFLFADRFIDLAEEDVDVAVRTGPLADASNLMARRLASQAMVVCAAPAYLAARGRPALRADLAGHEAIVYRRSGRVPPWLFPGADGAIEAFVPAHRLRLDDMAAIADAAVAGHGLAWLPHWLVAADVAAGRLEIVLAHEQPYLYHVHAVWPKAALMPRRLRLAIDALAAGLPALMRGETA